QDSDPVWRTSDPDWRTRSSPPWTNGTALAVAGGTPLVAEADEPNDLTHLADLADQATAYAAAGRAASTRRAYDTAWRLYASWCDTQGLQAVPSKPCFASDGRLAHQGPSRGREAGGHHREGAGRDHPASRGGRQPQPPGASHPVRQVMKG